MAWPPSPRQAIQAIPGRARKRALFLWVIDDRPGARDRLARSERICFYTRIDALPISMSDRPSSSVPAGRRAARDDHAHESQFSLLREGRFAPFFWTQFLGAMNDNVFKIGFTSLVTYQAARFSGVDPKTAAFLISAIFILPFVLFSATSGQIADKYDKAVLTRFVKTFEIGVMLIGGAGFW